MVRFLVHTLLAVSAISSTASAQSCTGNPVAVEILGSGGPRINPQRASSSYLLWVDGHAKMLVDMGGGTSHRFGELRVDLEDVALMAVSHLHPDHISDLPALMWDEPPDAQGTAADGRSVGQRDRARLPDFPAPPVRREDRGVPGARTHGRGQAGQWRSSRDHHCRRQEAHPDDGVRRRWPDRDGDRHSPCNVPALAYRATTRGITVVFSTDQNGTDPKFVDFARGADILVMHMAIAAGTTSPLHAAPAVVGRIAQDAGRQAARGEPYRAVRSRCSGGGCEEGLYRPADRRRRSAMHGTPAEQRAFAPRHQSSIAQTKKKRPRFRGAKSVLGRKHPTEDASCVAQKAPTVVAGKCHTLGAMRRRL